MKIENIESTAGCEVGHHEWVFWGCDCVDCRAGTARTEMAEIMAENRDEPQVMACVNCWVKRPIDSLDWMARPVGAHETAMNRSEVFDEARVMGLAPGYKPWSTDLD